MYYIQNVDRGPIPTMGVLSENAFSLGFGLIPIVLQSGAYWAYPSEPSSLWCY